MRWRGRQARGRHALGAAVTGIPAAPVRPAQVPVLADQPWSERFPEALPGGQPVAADPTTSAVPPPEAPVPVAPVVAPPEALPQVPAARPAPEPAPPSQPGSLPPGPELLGELLPLATSRPPAQAAPLLPPAAAVAPVAAPAAPVPAAPAGPRIEIGFADGTFGSLDPASSAARALSDLVAELTSKDAGRGASAS